VDRSDFIIFRLIEHEFIDYNKASLCYTLVMQRTHWPTWKSFLQRWGLLSPACQMMGFTRPLIPIAAQLMYFGLPFFKMTAVGERYNALLTVLVDEDELRYFLDYLQEAGV